MVLKNKIALAILVLTMAGCTYTQDSRATRIIGVVEAGAGYLGNEIGGCKYVSSDELPGGKYYFLYRGENCYLEVINE